MNIPIYQVDAFTGKLFAGNPAAVCPLDAWLPDDVLQAIATENNLSETAFIVPDRDEFEIRWFTPTVEVALCGHATLASAFVVFHCIGRASGEVVFHTRKSGALTVVRTDDRLTMDFPACPIEKITIAPGLADALGVQPNEAYAAGEDLMAVFPDETAVRGLRPDYFRLEGLAKRGVIVTAEGDACDVVSRFFAPAAGIPEDPVTGSAHCALTPFWADRLGKTKLHARQISKRGGELWCETVADRVFMSGQAVLYLEGIIRIPS